jgi:hypothetical protein
VEVNVLSKDSSSMEPKKTLDGKFKCEDDGMTYETREDYDKHCMKSHMKTSGESNENREENSEENKEW